MNFNTVDSLTWKYQKKNWIVRIEDGNISVQTRFSLKTIALSDVDKVIWNGFSRVQIRGQKQTIDFSCTQIRDIPLRNEMIVFLRKAIPCEKQFGWKNLCYFIDKNPKEWLPEEKREPDPEKGEFLLTRKYWNKWIPWLIALTLLIIIGIPCIFYHLGKKFPIEFAQLSDPPGMMMISVIFGLLPWIMWLSLQFRFRKGVIVTKLSKDKDAKIFVVVMIICLMLPIGVGLIEKQLSPKAFDLFGKIIISAIFVVCLFFVIVYGIPEYRKTRQCIDEIPDDYIPETLTRYINAPTDHATE